MNGLREIALDIVRRPPLKILSSERLFSTERAAAQLERRKIGGSPPATPDQNRVDEIEPRALRRLLATMWLDPHWKSASAGVLARARQMASPSLDRAIISAYIRQYPTSHVCFTILRSSAAAAADAHDWLWSQRGARWSLWTDDGPATVRDAMSASAIEDEGLCRLLTGSAFLAAAKPR